MIKCSTTELHLTTENVLSTSLNKPFPSFLFFPCFKNIFCISDHDVFVFSWNYFPHDDARSRVFRWGEDGLLGITDKQCRLCLGLSLWNGRDPILKERLFGLTGLEVCILTFRAVSFFNKGGENKWCHCAPVGFPY